MSFGFAVDTLDTVGLPVLPLKAPSAVDGKLLSNMVLSLVVTTPDIPNAMPMAPAEPMLLHVIVIEKELVDEPVTA
jgi:hypothetical protein